MSEDKPVSDSTDEPPARSFSVVDRRFWARKGDTDQGEKERSNRPTYVQQLEEQLAERDRRLQEVTEKHRQAIAEFEHARARLARDVGQEVERHKRSMVAELLEVMDSLDRALQLDADSVLDPLLLRQGVELVRKQFLDRLANLGVRQAASLGQPFDPQRHQAVSVVPVADTSQHDLVVGVVKEAYTIGEEVLRPAQVAVGRWAAAAGQEN